jgi:hypothetical protein
LFRSIFSNVFIEHRYLSLLGETSSKSYNHESGGSSTNSPCVDTRTDEHDDTHRQQEIDDECDTDDIDHVRSSNGTMIFLYKCSLCSFASNTSWTTQEHINKCHQGQSNAYVQTECQSNTIDTTDRIHSKKFKTKTGTRTATTSAMKMPLSMPLSPTSALAKAKFSPAVEEALLSLQSSKIKHAGLYTVQPKFGIKRLKCRHCFYRSNWKTDMIRHVRIRHNLTEPDHSKG